MVGMRHFYMADLRSGFQLEPSSSLFSPQTNQISVRLLSKNQILCFVDESVIPFQSTLYPKCPEVVNTTFNFTVLTSAWVTILFLVVIFLQFGEKNRVQNDVLFFLLRPIIAVPAFTLVQAKPVSEVLFLLRNFTSESCP